jgi:hypothetical protein
VHASSVATRRVLHHHRSPCAASPPATPVTHHFPHPLSAARQALAGVPVADRCKCKASTQAEQDGESGLGLAGLL